MSQDSEIGTPQMLWASQLSQETQTRGAHQVRATVKSGRNRYTSINHFMTCSVSVRFITDWVFIPHIAALLSLTLHTDTAHSCSGMLSCIRTRVVCFSSRRGTTPLDLRRIAMCGWTSKRYRKGGDVLVAGWYLESDGYAGPQVSKQHAVLSVLAGPRVCFLKDLGSRNGTVLFLGEAQARLPLTDGDRVQV